MRPLMWFRQDLRVTDNTALLSACQDASRGVVAVFVICPRQWRKNHDWGWPKADFVLRNLAELSTELEKLNIALRILETPDFSGVPEALRKLASEHECDALYFNREYEINELERDEAVADRLEAENIKTRSFTDLTLVEPGEVRTKEGKWYSVFTPFKKAVYETWSGEGHPPPAGKPRKQPEMIGAPDDVPRTIEGFDGEPGFRADLWPAGEHPALTRLGVFCAERIDDYKDKRDTPAINGTSCVSPYLSAGVLSPRQCLERAMEANNHRYRNGKKGPDHWISEILWREFYKHFVVGFPRVVKRKAFRTEYDEVRWEENADGLQAWKDGRTGYPIVDAAMRQLNQTGWMHNRLRMIVAMFLTKDLFIDWREGERYFAQRLIDYDFASNNGGWQWSASTGADAAPYFRIYNPVSQSKRHDERGDFIRKFCPELSDLSGDALHDPGALPPDARRDLDYPDPIVNHAEAREAALAAFKALNEKDKRPVREI